MAHEGGLIDFASEKDKLQNWDVYLLQFERQETTLVNTVTTTLDDCDSITGWQSPPISTTPTLDTVTFKEGTASINLGASTLGNADYHKTISSFDLTDTTRSALVWFYIVDITDLDVTAALIMKLGAGPTDFYGKTYDRADLSNGWNLLGGVISDFAVTGSPDITAITYLRLDMNTTGSIAVGDAKMDYWRFNSEAAVTSSSTALSGADVGDFPNQGYIQIADEIIKYSNKTGDTPGAFEASVRGAFNTVAASAASGAVIREPFDEYWSTKIGVIPGGLDISDDRALMGMPKGIKGSIKPDEGKSDISDIKVNILNKNNIVSKMLSLVPMKNRKATLWAGYESLPATAYEKEFVGLVKNWNPDSSLASYNFSISDMKRTYRQALFTQIGKTRLSANINNAVTSIAPVNSTDAASAGDRKFTDPASGYDIETYLQINDEIMGPVTAKSASSFTVSARGVFGTTAAAHSDDDDVTEIIVFDSRNPIDMILQMLTSTGATGSNGIYDVLPSHCGFAIDQSLVDIDTFETERDEWTVDYEVGFLIKDSKDDGKSWMEFELLRMVGGYIVVQRDGVLTLRMYHRQALLTERIVNQDSIIKVAGYNTGHDNIINQTLVSYSKRPDDDEFRELSEKINADSISAHGASPLMITSFDGIHGQNSLFDPLLDGEDILADYEARLTNRYENPAPFVTLRLTPEFRDINTGDLIAATHPDIPNLDPATGSSLTGLGVENEEYEIIARKMNYASKDQYVEVDALRAIFAEGQTKFFNFFYEQFLQNTFLIIFSNFFPPGPSPQGAAILWDTGRFTLTANKIRLRASMSKFSNPLTNVRGVLELDDGTEIFSDADVLLGDVSVWPTFSFQTFEFTIPGGDIGKDIVYAGAFKLAGADLGRYYWQSFDSFGSTDPNLDTKAIVFDPTTFTITTTISDQDMTADVAEVLL